MVSAVADALTNQPFRDISRYSQEKATSHLQPIIYYMKNKGILAIGGSDPSGGAGIQADLKTFACFRVPGAAAITCLTAQNSHGVEASLAVEPSFVARQVELVLQDIAISHIKTGMIGTVAIADALHGVLKNFQGQIVCDPVFRASDGTALFEENAQPAYEASILALATVVTPNLDEFTILTGRPLHDDSDALKAASYCFGRFPRLEAVVITGGHSPLRGGSITDRLLLRSSKGPPLLRKKTHPFHATRMSHGTGCTFASAYGAAHLRTTDHEKAFFAAVDFVDSILESSIPLSSSNTPGPVLHHLAKALQEE